MKHGIDTVATTVQEWQRYGQALRPEVIGCYGNGRYANHTVAKQGVPSAICVVYDVNGSLPECDLLDIEPGDARPDAAHGWAQRWRAAKVKRVLSGPGLYASASSTSQVISDMLDHGWSRHEFLIQSAHYNGVAHVCGPDSCHYPQADSCQYIDKGPHGENTDLTVWEDHCFTAAPVVVHKPHNPHYELFDTTKRSFGSERALVQRYDRVRAQAHPSYNMQLVWLRFWLMLAARRLQSLGGLDQFNRRWRKRELEDRAAGRRLV